MRGRMNQSSGMKYSLSLTREMAKGESQVPNVIVRRLRAIRPSVSFW